MCIYSEFSNAFKLDIPLEYFDPVTKQLLKTPTSYHMFCALPFLYNGANEKTLEYGLRITKTVEIANVKRLFDMEISPLPNFAENNQIIQEALQNNVTPCLNWVSKYIVNNPDRKAIVDR